LPDTVASRSIPIRLKRRRPDEHIDDFIQRDVEAAAEPHFQSIVSWASFNASKLAEARPARPEELGDRAADVWEPSSRLPT